MFLLCCLCTRKYVFIIISVNSEFTKYYVKPIFSEKRPKRYKLSFTLSVTVAEFTC